MNEIVRRPEGQTIWDVFNDFDGFFDDFVRPRRGQGAVATGGGALVPPMDVTETEHEYLVKAELPGVNKDDLDISIHDGVLTINAESRYEKKAEEEGRVLRQERRYGKYVRTMRLGKDIDASKVEAEYKDGVLSLTLPKVEQVKPKKIEVAVS